MAMDAVLDFPVKPEARPYVDAFAAAAGEPRWLARLRERGIARFAELGFPSRKSEAWRYLDLRGLETAPMLPLARPGREAARTELADVPLADAAARLVLLDGRFAAEMSRLDGLPPGIALHSMRAAIADRPDLVRSLLEAEPLDPARPFAALNSAFFGDGFVLEAAPGVRLDRPIEIVHLASGGNASLHTRSLIVLRAGADLTLFENYAGAGRYWRNDVAEWRLAEGAQLRHVALVAESAEAVHLGEVATVLDKGASLDAFALLLQGRTMRREANVASAGEGARTALNGAFLLAGRQEANFLTTVDHRAPHGETREVVKGVAAGRAHGAFQGRIIVRPGAQKVDAHQLSRNLLLSPRASIDTKPELEIRADDVKCSHGASLGDLDEDALFYLCARGISRDEARRLLIEAFIRDALDLVPSPPLRAYLSDRLARRLEHLEEQE
jgi:Fe-S cluster assembly protein SufD